MWFVRTMTILCEIKRRKQWNFQKKKIILVQNVNKHYQYDVHKIKTCKNFGSYRGSGLKRGLSELEKFMGQKCLNWGRKFFVWEFGPCFAPSFLNGISKMALLLYKYEQNAVWYRRECQILFWNILDTFD